MPPAAKVSIGAFRGLSAARCCSVLGRIRWKMEESIASSRACLLVCIWSGGVNMPAVDAIMPFPKYVSLVLEEAGFFCNVNVEKRLERVYICMR